jgi:hypothetical protein
MTGQAVEQYQEPAAVALTDREMRSIEFQARAIIALDKRVGGDKEKGLALAITLYSLGLPVTITNAKKLHLIGDEVVESAQLLVGLLAMHGHEVRVVEEGDERAVVRGRRHGAGEPHEVTYTIEQARSSGALDEWVEKWETTSNGKKYPVRHYLVFEGLPNDQAAPEWAQTLINRGQVKRLDAWHRYTSDMLVNRALRRLAKRMGGDALLGVGGPEWEEDRPPAVQPRPGDIVLDDEFGEPLDDPAEPTESAHETLAEDAAADEVDQDAAHRNECSRVHAATDRIPSGTWRQLWAKAWREAGLPAKALDLTPDQLEPARLITRQYIALAALDSIGLSGTADRHAFVTSATGGETESTKALTAEQLQAVMRAVTGERQRLEEECRLAEEAAAMEAERRAGDVDEPQYAPGEEPF